MTEAEAREDWRATPAHGFTCTGHLQGQNPVATSASLLCLSVNEHLVARVFTKDTINPGLAGLRL